MLSSVSQISNPCDMSRRHEKLDNESGWDRVLTANVKKKWVELSNTIELGERLMTFRTGLKVLTTYFQMLHGYHRP